MMLFPNVQVGRIQIGFLFGTCIEVLAKVALPNISYNCTPFLLKMKYDINYAFYNMREFLLS